MDSHNQMIVSNLLTKFEKIPLVRKPYKHDILIPAVGEVAISYSEFSEFRVFDVAGNPYVQLGMFDKVWYIVEFDTDESLLLTGALKAICFLTSKPEFEKGVDAIIIGGVVDKKKGIVWGAPAIRIIH